jgi:hypothetical protein
MLPILSCLFPLTKNSPIGENLPCIATLHRGKLTENALKVKNPGFAPQPGETLKGANHIQHDDIQHYNT